MSDNKKTHKHSLVSIANPRLAKNLETQNKKTKKKRQGFSEGFSFSESAELDELVLEREEIKTQTWRALFILNLVRYGLALWLLAGTALANSLPWAFYAFPAEHQILVLACIVLLLGSAIAYSYFSLQQTIPLGRVLIQQFILDLIITTLIAYLSGSSSREFFILYYIIVTTGSVVLSRKHALALGLTASCLLAAGPIWQTLMLSTTEASAWWPIALNALTLLFSAYLVSSIAQYIGKAQLTQYIPGDESLENFLLEQEKSALKAALKKTNGNKTQAAALLGLSFRSFRYKLAKHSIK